MIETYHVAPRWYFDHTAPLDRIEIPVLKALVCTPASWFGYNQSGCLVIIGPEGSDTRDRLQG